MNLRLRTQMQMFLGLYERETHSSLTRLSDGVATAMDIGVAFGEHTLFFLKNTKAASVYAFEGDPGWVGTIRENLHLNGLDESPRLEIVSKFLGDSEQETPLDSFAARVQPPCMIKMDVDGAEVRILNSAKAINALPGVRWLIETHSRELEADCLKLLRAAGFETRIIPQRWWRALVPNVNSGATGVGWLAAWKS